MGELTGYDSGYKGREDRMMKQYFFSSMENAERVLLIFLIIWIVLVLVIFIKALAFCNKSSETPSTQITVGYECGSHAGGSSKSSAGSTLKEAMRITEICGCLVFALELCCFVFLMLA